MEDAASSSANTKWTAAAILQFGFLGSWHLMSRFKLLMLITSISGLVSATIGAFYQKPHPDAYRAAGFTQIRNLNDWWNWYWYPIERNAYKRLPAIDRNLNDVFHVKDTNHVWAVGDGGLILHSMDLGESWEQVQQSNIDWGMVSSTGTTGSAPAGEPASNDPGTSETAAGDDAGGDGGAERPNNAANPPPEDANSMIEVPNVTDTDIGIAQAILTRAGLTSQIEYEQAKAPQGQVMEQSPAPGQRVQRGSVVFLRVSGEAPNRPAPKSGASRDSPNPSAHPRFASALTGAILAEAPPSNDPKSGQPDPRQNSPVQGSTESNLPLDAANRRNISDDVKNQEPPREEKKQATIDDFKTGSEDPNKNASKIDEQRFLPPGITNPPNKRTGPPVRDLKSVFFISETHGWAVGEAGTILATDNGGQTWKLQASGTNWMLTSVHFVDEQHGWAVSADLDGYDKSPGSILTTFDGGQTWRLLDYTVDRLTSVYFVDIQYGFAVGESGTIISTRDGGQNWKTENSGTIANLYSVHFVDAQRGWAVGESGNILASIDGGETWKPQSSGTGYSLRAVHFVDGQRGWAVGWDGTILATIDGGQIWSSRTSGGTSARLSSVHFADGQLGWAVGKNGTILATTNGGLNWKRQSLEAIEYLYSVYFPDGQHGWAVGSSGTILATSDSGQLWKPQNGGTRDWLKSVYFSNASNGWTVGGGSTILATANGGKDWKLQRIEPAPGLESVYFANAMKGFVVGQEGRILSTIDGGRNWERQKNATWYPLYSVYVSDGNRACAVGLDGTILVTIDGGQNWKTENSGTTANLDSVHFVDAQRGWAVGESGNILASIDGGETWKPQSSGNNAWLMSVHFTDGLHGWAVGRYGTILATTDGGQNWKQQASGTTADLNSVHCTDAQHCWAVGDAGTMIVTTDGTTWKSQRDYALPYASFPAPWCYAFWGAAILCLVPVFKPQKAVVIEQSAADEGASDRPLEPGDPDPLNLGALARGLAYFLLNPKTEAPLTLAITGQWGSGKSSLMNLTRHELKMGGFRPIWFNAWHHQTEAHLLASLLENIRAKAAPSICHLAGMWFRIRLTMLRVWNRFRSYPMRSALIVGVIAVCGVFLYGYLRTALTTPQPQTKTDAPADAAATVASLDAFEFRLQWLGMRFSLTNDAARRNQPWRSRSADKPEEKDWLTGVVGYVESILGKGTPIPFLLGLLVAGLGPFRQAISVFGVNPASLAAGAASMFRPGASQAQTSFRHRFAQEFLEVTKALGRRRKLVIFIDDLDRCAPASVMEMLQAVNYLTTAAPCVIVMGFAPQYVMGCISLEYKDLISKLKEYELAESKPPTVNPGGNGKPSAASTNQVESPAFDRKKSEFAQDYLHKLVNIEVPVPEPDPQKSRELLVVEKPPPKPKWWEKSLAALPRLGVPLTGLAVWALIVAGMTYVGIAFWKGPIAAALAQRQSAVTATKPASADGASTINTGHSKPDEQGNTGVKEKDGIVEADSNNLPATFVKADTHVRSAGTKWYALPLVAVGLMLGALSRVERPRVKDSELFTKALREWYAALLLTDPTPREVKRYRNRVRFYAMRQRAYDPPAMWWRRLSAPVTPPSAQQSPPPTPTSQSIPDDVLVGLAAIEEVDRGWLWDPAWHKGFDEFARTRTPALPTEVTTFVTQANRGQEYVRHLERFRDLTEGITVR